MRAKKDAQTGLQVTPDGLHLHVGGYRRQGTLSPPTQGASYHPSAALLYILRDVLADGEHQARNADVAWPEPLRPRPHAPTPVWLVTTDDQCARATEQAQLRADRVIVQVGEGQPSPVDSPAAPPYWWLQKCHTTRTWQCTRWSTSRETRHTWWCTTRRPGVAQGTHNGTPVLGKHDRRS